MILLHIHITVWYLTIERMQLSDNEGKLIESHNRYCFLCFTIETVKKK